MQYMLTEHGVFPHEVAKLPQKEKILMLELIRKQSEQIKAKGRE